MNEHSYLICVSAPQVCVDADRIVARGDAVVAIISDSERLGAYILFYRSVKRSERSLLDSVMT